mgnify:CR=1 FL=1
MGIRATFLYGQNGTWRLNKWLDGILPSGVYSGLGMKKAPGMTFSFDHANGFLVTPIDTKASKIPTSTMVTQQGIVIHFTDPTPGINVRPTDLTPRTDALILEHSYVSNEAEQKEPIVISIENLSNDEKENLEGYASTLPGDRTLIGFLHLPENCNSLDMDEVWFEKRGIPLLAGEGTLSKLAELGLPSPKVLTDYKDSVLATGFYLDQSNNRYLLSMGVHQFILSSGAASYRYYSNDQWIVEEIANKRFLAEQYVAKSQRGKQGGVATLGSDGKVPKEQLDFNLVNQDISSEAKAREDGDKALAEKIQQLSQQIGADIEGINQSIDSIRTDIQELQNLANKNKADIGINQTAINNLGNLIIQESNTRQNAISNLQSDYTQKINAEASVRYQNDLALQASINANADSISSNTENIDKIIAKMGGQYFEWMAPTLVDLSLSLGEGGLGFLSSNPQEGLIEIIGEGGPSGNYQLRNGRAMFFTARTNELFISDDYPQHQTVFKVIS